MTNTERSPRTLPQTQKPSRIFSSDNDREFEGAVTVHKAPEDAVENGSARQPRSAGGPRSTVSRKKAQEVANLDEGVAEINSACEFGGSVASKSGTEQGYSRERAHRRLRGVLDDAPATSERGRQ